MKRRGFLGAFVGAMALLIARKRDPFAKDASVATPSTESFRPGFVFHDDSLYRYLNERDMAIELKSAVDRPAIIARVYSLTSKHEARFSIGLFGRPNPSQWMRQARYQTKKAADAIEYTRRTGYAQKWVEREGHRLSGRIYYQHEATGRVRWSRPA